MGCNPAGGAGSFAFAPRPFMPRLLTATPPASPAMRPTILVVDDSKAVRLIAQKVLSDFDCEMSEATNGFTALFAMERALPDLIVLDVSMPTMDGLEMLTLLQSKPKLKVIPVIMLTSPADHRILDQIAALGVSGIVTKPFTPAALLEKIRHVLKLKPLKPAANSKRRSTQ